MLTDKAKEDFCKWEESHVYMVYHGCPESCQNAIIVEWLDSVGIYVDANIFSESMSVPLEKCYSCEVSFSKDHYFEVLHLGNKFKRRDTALEFGIIKANEIYNQK